MLPQALVPPQVLHQHFVSLRNVEIGRRRDFTEVPDGFVEGSGHGLALVEVEGAPVVQHQTEVVAAAEGVVPREPVADHQRFVTEEGEDGPQHLLVAGEHAMAGDHALRDAGGAGREQDLGDAVRGDFRERGIRLAEEVGNQVGAAAWRRILADQNPAVRRDYDLDGPREYLAVGDEDQPGRKQIENVTELGEILGNEGVRRRDRRVGDAGVHGGHAKDRMVRIVARKDRDGALN